MKYALPVCALIAFLAGTDAPRAGDAQKDIEKLQGTWTTKKDDKEAILKITGDKFSFEIPSEKDFHRGVFKVNTSANPKEIDMMVTETSKEKHKDKTALGIYEFKGDVLRWCSNAPGREGRPKEFSEKLLLLEFQRQK